MLSLLLKSYFSVPSYHTEIIPKTLLLKTPLTLVTRHSHGTWRHKIALIRSHSTYCLVFIVPEVAMQAAAGWTITNSLPQLGSLGAIIQTSKTRSVHVCSDSKNATVLYQLFFYYFPITAWPKQLTKLEFTLDLWFQGVKIQDGRAEAAACQWLEQQSRAHILIHKQEEKKRNWKWWWQEGLTSHCHASPSKATSPNPTWTVTY